MRRKLIKFGSELLQDSGIDITKTNNSKGTNIWRFIFTFSLFVLADVSALMVSLTNIGDFYSFVIPIPYIAGAVIVQGGVYCMYRYRKMIGGIFSDMDGNFYTYPDEDLILVEYPWYLDERNITMTMTLVKYSSFSIFFFLWIPILAEVMYYGRIKTMLFPMWTPCKLSTLRRELFAISYQCVQGFCGLWLNYVMIVFLLIMVIEFTRQYRRLITAVLTLESRSSEHALVEGCFDQVLRENLVHCIRHHQILQTNFRLFEIWFSIFFSIELSISAVTFTFALYVAMNAPSWGQILNYFTVFFFIWMNLLIRCLMSEVFSDLNDKLAKTILWSTPWYKTNEKNRRLFAMFHSFSCHHQLSLFGLSIFEASRVTFGKLVRLAYSFFNVLKRKNY